MCLLFHLALRTAIVFYAAEYRISLPVQLPAPECASNVLSVFVSWMRPKKNPAVTASGQMLYQLRTAFYHFLHYAVILRNLQRCLPVTIPSGFVPVEALRLDYKKASFRLILLMYLSIPSSYANHFGKRRVGDFLFPSSRINNGWELS